ncbi:E3 ubiquitin-protein ligase Midline-1-like [Puntigrus tetrazona]|uniref:E3 ubiquitin-protein ligase Midline-1-like n=1 Tax=Puntigrus tetrazona TaxID=1606681 RepID=UPI001C8A0E6E|nr:E3 ubiquitin-protein ligase Midline-1-like [Puntigrus tetrazona]
MDDPKTSRDGPLFCPECQILFPPDLELEINSDLQRKVQDACPRAPTLDGSSQTSPIIMCDQCIGKTEVAVKSCLTCDASLCSAHTLLHQQRKALRGHSIIKVTEDLTSFKCKEHGEELKLFCQEDRISVCCLCIAVGSHKNHQAVTLQEACTDLKEVLETNKSLLLQRKQLAKSALQDLEPLFSEVSENAEAYRVRIVEKYSQIKAHIEEDQKLMLAILETEEIYTNKWLRWRSESLKCHVKDINAALRSSQTLLEEESDVRFVKHFKKHGLGSQVELPLVSVIEQEYSTLNKMKTIEQLVDSLDEVVLKNTQRLWSSFRAVSLDPQKAHPELEVSADRLEVHWSKKPTPDRKRKTNINSQYSVRSKERFSSGSHYWEVAIWKKPYWLIGLSYGSTTGDQDSELCKGDFNSTFCYIYHGNGKYLICQDSNEKPLAVRKTIQKLGVWVDFQKGNVSFYDGDTLALLHSFCVEFSGPVYPIFNPCIDINGQNNQPLAIVHLRNTNIPSQIAGIHPFPDTVHE